MAIFMEGKKNSRDNSKGLTATSEDILNGKTAEVNGEIVIGNMINRSTIENDGIGVSATYPTIPANPNDVNVQ